MAFFKFFKPGELSLESGGKFGNFRLHELVNSGGMAQLWLASNTKEETFALRIAHSNLNNVDRKRFIHGCETLAELPPHRNLIGYMEHGKISGVPFLRMEYVEGSNMRELLAQDSEMLIEKIWEILFGIGEVLEHVHDNGWLHLDFKPENVVISRGGKLRLIDFDLCVRKPEKPIILKSAGTPSYMAPEILLQRPADQRADIFAFGVWAYELFTHTKAFSGDTPDEVLRKMLNQEAELVPPREYNPHISAEFEQVILKCMDPDPNKRYPHMSVVMNEFRSTPV